MKLRIIHKLMALIVLTSVIPLIGVSLLLIDIGRDQVQDKVQQVHRLEAGTAALNVRQFLNGSAQRLVADLEGSIDGMLDEDIQSALIWMLGKQDNMLTFRALQAFDSRGRPVGLPVHLPTESIPAEHRDKYLVDADDLDEFGRQLPLAATLADGVPTLSSVYINDRRGEALVALAVPITDRVGQVKWVVAGELSLRPIQRIAADVTVGTAGYAYVVDGEGRAVAHPLFDRVRRQTTLANSSLIAKALGTTRPGALAFQDGDGVEQLGAWAPVLWGGWRLVVEQPAADAYRPVSDMRTRALYILLVALTASLSLGLLHVRGVVLPLRQVMSGMRRIMDGTFDTRLDVKSGDELGELGGAFNTMGDMLARYKREIETWNRELQDRVDAKTRALEKAQVQLIQSSKMSALGHLGAGIAHELNNPLTGVVGQAVLLKRRLAKTELADADRAKLLGYVEHVEKESSRCREIIHGLLSFSQATAGGTDRLDVNRAIGRLLLLVQNNTRSAGVTLREDLAADLPTVEANEQQLQQVLMNLITNSLQAMPEGGEIAIATQGTDDGISISVSDTGRGIAAEHLPKVFDPFFTTKEVWQNTGLGLAVCYSIVESHGGRIEIESEVGRGTVVTVRLPRFTARPTSSPLQEEPVGLRRRHAVAAGA